MSCENADELSALLQLVLKESASRIPASAPIFKAAIEQHKANLANIESLESHSAKLVESHQLMSAERDAALAELEKLRALLASGQCVDLARLSDSQLAEVRGYGMSEMDEGSQRRAWLIEKAGVKL